MTENAEAIPSSGLAGVRGTASAPGSKAIDGGLFRLPLVGIAAAAGGLDAVGRLVRSLPRSLEMVYILAQQLPAGSRNPMPVLLADETELEIVELTRDTVPEAGRIYVPPPGMDAVIEGDLLCARPPLAGRDGIAPSADRLFGTLARERGGGATGIILSGVGGDGSYGAQAIREAGGITIAQRPDTARHDGMPLSAIRTGCVDLVLAPQEIGPHLARLAAAAADRAALSLDADRRGPLAELMDLLLSSGGVDFRDYRDNTVRRRLARRMAALAIDRLDTYVAHCRGDRAELEALHRDLLISVTRFFRDPEAFARLGAALTRKLRSRAPGDPIRVWVAGCATGEEAYSVAILVVEAMGGMRAIGDRPIQVFATDIDDRALEVARRGLYPLSALDDVPPAFRAEYFVERRGLIEIAPALRRLVRFSHHNVLQDPPFPNLDLVSLRNVLIYFKPPLQERVVARMHFALRPGGMLALGPSETLNGLPKPFEETPDGACLVKIWDTAQTPGGLRQGNEAAPVDLPAPSRDRARQDPDGPEADHRMFERLARAVAPNGFLMDRGQQILRVLGDISAVTGMSDASGLTLDASILAPPLREDVARLIPLALRARELREGPWHPLDDGNGQEVRLDAYPIADADGVLNQVLFALRRRDAPRRGTDPAGMTPEESADCIQTLDSELQAAKSALHRTVEELRSFNDELHSVNEELQSSNQELQAVNEELETANEELQSTNEELITVNEEMQIKASALRTANRDLDAILLALPIAVIVIDETLRVRRASDRALHLFRIPAPGPEGIALADCAAPQGMPLLPALARDTIETGTPHRVRLRSGAILRQLRVTPHAAGKAGSRGAMLILSEIELDGPQASDLPEDRDRTPRAFVHRHDRADVFGGSGGPIQPARRALPARTERVAIRDATGRIATIVGTVRDGEAP